MGYRQTTAWIAVSVLLWSLAAAGTVYSAPKRPGLGWNACSPTGEQLNRLQSANPGAMEACRNMAQQAQAQGKSFAFMCDGSGNVACCNDSNCVQVGSVALRPKLPGIRPDQLPGTLQQQPNTQPGGRPGVAPPQGGGMPPAAR